MTKILIIYSTKDGQTLKICQALQTDIKQHGNEVTLVPIDDAGQVDLASFDKIVIGASIHYGRHHPDIHAFIKRNQSILDSKPNAFFSVNVVARKPEKRQADTNPYLKKFLKSISWQPKQIAVFAGKIDYPSYNIVDRTVIRMIMWLTKGPTDSNAIVEFADWDQVRSFANIISEM